MKDRKDYIILFFLILFLGICQAVVAFFFDMRESVDTEIYVNAADQLCIGKFLEGREIFYFSYILLLALILSISDNLESIIFVQFIISAFALIAIFNLTKKLSKSIISAVLACVLYIFWYEFLQWNLIVYTDAIFANMVIICFYLFYELENKQRLFLIPIILFTAFIRPTGIGVLFAFCTYFIQCFLSDKTIKKYYRIGLLAVLSISFAWLLNTALYFYIDSFIESYQMAEVIYPKINLLIEPSTSLFIPKKENPPIFQLYQFIVNNPIYFLKLSILKGGLFLVHIKPYYSLLHNIFILIFLVPVYFFAIKGFIDQRNNKLIVLFISFIVFQIITVSLTSENWDGRFLLPILPMIFIFSAIGIQPIFEKFIFFLKKELFLKQSR